jgi:CheY-like chemotaxis protein
MIENDEDDRLLTREMFQQEWPTADIEFVLADELASRLPLIGPPQLILLTMLARPYTAVELIKAIRATKGCELTPIVVLSESARQDEIAACYSAGANSFIKKPASYADTLFKIKAFVNYWGHTVELPAVATIAE